MGSSFLSPALEIDWFITPPYRQPTDDLDGVNRGTEDPCRGIAARLHGMLFCNVCKVLDVCFPRLHWSMCVVLIREISLAIILQPLQRLMCHWLSIDTRLF